MPLAAGAIGAGAGLVTGIGGLIQSNNKQNDANAARENAVKQWLAINVPDPAQQQIELQRYKSTGTFSPQLENTFKQSNSELKNIIVDPTSRSAEVSALQKMQDLSRNGGMDAESKQQEAQALNSANTNAQGQRGAIVQNFAQRGVGGSGAQLAAELQAQQGDSNAAASQGLQSAAAAQQRALQALSSSSNMAASLNSQDYNQASKAAAAQDAINQFNTQNAQAVAGNNTRQANQAQQYNLTNAQNLSNSNVDLANKQEIANKGLIQQNYQNQVQKAAGIGNSYAGQATQAAADADRIGNQWAGIGSAISQGAGAVGQYENAKAKTPASVNGWQPDATSKALQTASIDDPNTLQMAGEDNTYPSKDPNQETA